MKTETYKGRKLKTLKGKEYGYAGAFVNGVNLGKHLGDEDDALKWMRGTIDHADEVGVSSGRYGAEWYAPGTFELCEHGHAKEIGGECAHHYCVVERPAPAAEEAPLASPKWFDDTERYERASYAELRGGDVVMFPRTLWEGEPADWQERGYQVDHAEESAPGVWLLWVAGETSREPFFMACGERAAAGVLRRKSTPVVDPATTNRSVDAYLSREYPALFPDVEEDADTVTASRAYHSHTGHEYGGDDPADGMATVTAWFHRQQSGVWTVDGTTVAVRTDDRGHIRGSVIVLETIGSKFPGS